MYIYELKLQKEIRGKEKEKNSFENRMAYSVYI